MTEPSNLSFWSALVSILSKIRPNVLLMLAGSGIVIGAIFFGMLGYGAAPEVAWEAVKTSVASWITACVTLGQKLIK